MANSKLSCEVCGFDSHSFICKLCIQQGKLNSKEQVYDVRDEIEKQKIFNTSIAEELDDLLVHKSLFASASFAHEQYESKLTALEEQVNKAREALQRDRITLASRKEALRLRKERLSQAKIEYGTTFGMDEFAKKDKSVHPTKSDHSVSDMQVIHNAIHHSMQLASEYKLSILSKERRRRVMQLLVLFPVDLAPDNKRGITPSVGDKYHNKKKQSIQQNFGKIANLPFPSNIEECLSMDPLAVTTSLALMVRVMLICSSYLSLPIPFKMVFLGSVASVSRWGKGMQEIKLSPTESNFSEGLHMLESNIRALCFYQGVPMTMIHKSDMLHNIWQLLHSPSLGDSIHNSITSADKRTGRLSNARNWRPRTVSEVDAADIEDSAWDIVDCPQPPLPSQPEDIEHWVQSGATM